MVRAKFRCNSITEFLQYDGRKLRSYKFLPVIANSEENKKFFDATPSGELVLGVLNDNVKFELGKEYYLDFTEAE